MDVKVTKSLLMTALITGSVLWGDASAFAEESVGEFALDPMVVTAQRMETRDLDTPATTTIITAKDIKDKGYTSVFDALEQSIGVTSYSYSPSGDDLGGSQSRFYIRGFDKGTLVLVNGAPINIMNYSSTEGIPLEAVEKIEIIKGSNSVLYGAEAMAGVVNIITKRGGDSKVTVKGTAGNHKNGYGMSIVEKDFFASFEREYLDERDQSNKIFPKSTYHWKDGKGNKSSFYISSKLNDKLSLDWSRVAANKYRYAMEVKNGSPTGLIRYGSSTGKYVYDTQKNNINLIYNDQENLFKSVLAYNNRRLDSTYYYYKADQSLNTAKTKRGTAYNVYGITSDTQKTWKFNNENDSLTSGITFKKEHYKELANTDNSIGRNAYSIYSSYSHQFNNKFTGILGMRGEFTQDNGWDDSHNVFLPQLQFLYKANDNWSLYTNIGKSFDMPAINSKYYSTKLINWNIKPQQGWTYELGSKYVAEKDSLKLALFHMDIKDKFEWVKEDTLIPGGDANTNVQINGGKFRNTGIEAEFVHLIDTNWKYNLGLTISNPEIQSGDKWVQESARLQASAGVQYDNKKFTGNLGLFVTADREDSYYNSLGQSAKTYGYDHKVPNRVHLNSTLQYRPEKNHTFALNLYNLLDRDNCINENENYDLPFNWTLTYSYSF